MRTSAIIIGALVIAAALFSLPSGDASAAATCGYDLNCSGVVDATDIAIERTKFGSTAVGAPAPPYYTCAYDLDCDGDVDATDIGLERAAFRAGPGGARLIFGLGPQASAAESALLNRDAPLAMYTSWYNGPSDLGFMRSWRDSGFIADDIYGTGRAAHLVIWSGGAEEVTAYGCGRAYPVSSAIDSDMAQLAQIWAGAASGPPLYVTLFTEFQTYPCVDNQWSGQETYYARLQQKMIEIRNIFLQYAPNAEVSIGWGGWQRSWDDPAKGGGASLMPRFAATMDAMDFQSFQAMQNGGNVDEIVDMTAYLGDFGPVMLAHYKPDHGSDAAFLADVTAIFTQPFMSGLMANGLFAWSWMDSQMFNDPDEPYILVVDAVRRHGQAP